MPRRLLNEDAVREKLTKHLEKHRDSKKKGDDVDLDDLIADLEGFLPTEADLLAPDASGPMCAAMEPCENDHTKDGHRRVMGQRLCFLPLHHDEPHTWEG